MRIVPSTLVLALLGALAALSRPCAASGQDVHVRAYATPSGSVAVGRPFVLNLEISGAQSLDREPVVPELPFAQFLGSGTSTSMQMAGGRTSVSVTIQYRFQALEEGTFQVPAIEVPVAGGTHTTDPFDITVGPPSGAAPAPGNAPPGRAPAGGGISEKDLFVTAEASRRTVLTGQPVVVEYRLWTRLPVTSYNFTRVPEPQGFWVEDAQPPGQPEVEQVERDGATYATAVIRRVALVPTAPGDRTLDPLGVEAQVRVRRGSDPFEGLFGRSSLFGSTIEPTAVLSNPLTIEVRPLPPGRPEGFSGLVGTLDVEASVDRAQVDANQAVTLTVRVSGEGNIRGVQPPEIAFPADFEVFPPETSEAISAAGSTLRGSKTFAYVLIPRAPGDREIPAISLGYFDPSAGVYRVAATDAIPLTVHGTVAGGPVPLARGGVEQLRRDIRFIHLGAPSLRRADRGGLGGPALWIVALLPMAAVLGAVALRRHRDRLEGDVAWARGRRAGRVARKRLAEARRLATADDTRAFYAEVARALRGLVADKVNVSEAGMQLADLERDLARASVSEEVVAELRGCLEHCDRQRFAPPGSDPHERERFLERAGDLMIALDRRIRRPTEVGASR
jgi:hypothetical protein